ncbi:TonB-dependent receptor [Blastomonas sp. AAP53]|uniref:TonB-dependent receptor n=1 Tax=Blastomonas sp. AAP53 TaxID=1248760 RepID=UPI0012672384|nr:TonB-dependent receptor [Blastomonas sp. AAP53]
MIKLHMATAVSALAVALAAPAYAQNGEQAGTGESQAQEGLSEIIVTAQRRQESVQDVPIAISAFSAEQLRDQGVSNTLQLGQYVPNLVAQNNTGIGSANAYFLRGLGSTETIATFDPPVGTYVDDIYLSRQNANNLALFDVARVEVLRGPQGTLFGRNTTGGAINVIMAEPGDTIGGYAEVGYGRYDKKMVRGSIDLPLADSFAIKVSGYWQDDDGYVKNVTTGERLNDDDGWGVRLGIKGELAPWARWRASYAHVVSEGENTLNFTCNPVNPTDCKGRFSTTGLRENPQSATPFAPLVIQGRKAGYGNGQKADTDIITSNLAFDIADKTTLSLITGYVSLTQQFALDFFDGRGGPSVSVPFPTVQRYARGGFTIVNDGSHQQFTQEIKLDGSLGNGLIDYVAGFFYIDERNRTNLADVFSISPATSLLLGDRIVRNRTEAYAGYVQADLNITEQLKLTAGVRYTDETKTLSISDNRPSCNDGTVEVTCMVDANLRASNGVIIPTSQTAKIWTPRFALNFKPNEDILLFASATKGFKSGGWNARATSPAQFLPFDEEKVWSYEAGLKTEFFDRRVRANITAFWMDVSDLQILAGLLNPATGAITFLTRNFADYRNKGIEAELTVAPVTGLTLYANVGYQDDKYRVPDAPAGNDIYGIQNVQAQLAACRTQLAAGQIPGSSNSALAGTPVNNAPACAAGIVTANGTISTPVRTPDWSLAIGGSYRAPLGDSGLTLVPSVNASYRSAQEVAIANLSIYNAPVTRGGRTTPANPFGDGAFITGSESPAAWLVNAGLALNGPDNAWQLAVECTNCFNEEFIQSSLSNYSYLNQPMMWTVRARYNF